MVDPYPMLKPLLFALPPEKAHRLTIRMLRQGMAPPVKKIDDPRLHTALGQLRLPNPIGMAAGFDKNAEAYGGILRLGFGAVEIGSVTPRAQPGNPRPRMFRLREDEAVINRLGFNNDGMEVVRQRLAGRDRGEGIVGVNLGKNKDTEHAVEDYVAGLQALYAHADYITVNISSPNTQGLRDLQQKHNLRSLVTALKAEQKHLEGNGQPKVPLFIKIAPDVTDRELEQMVEVILECNVDGLILTNTTTARPSTLRSGHAGEQGGLSGQPLKERSLEMMKKTYRLTEGRIPLIGVGGIGSAEDAIARIKAGASFVQLYTAMVYKGPRIVGNILEGMLEAMEREGVGSVREWVGSGV